LKKFPKEKWKFDRSDFFGKDIFLREIYIGLFK